MNNQLGTYPDYDSGVSALGIGESGDYFTVDGQNYFWSELNQTWLASNEVSIPIAETGCNTAVSDIRESDVGTVKVEYPESNCEYETADIAEEEQFEAVDHPLDKIPMESTPVEEYEATEATEARRAVEHPDDHIFNNDVSICGILRSRHIVHPFGSSFPTLEELLCELPTPRPGMWAFVGEVYPQDIYRCVVPGIWEFAKKGSEAYKLLTSWADYDKATAGEEALSAYLGKELYDELYSLKGFAQIWEDGSYAVKILGNTTIRNGQGSTQLTAYVFHGGEDVTSDFTSTDFTWKRTSNNTSDDETWNKLHVGIGRVLTVSKDDIRYSAVFTCEVMLND